MVQIDYYQNVGTKLNITPKIQERGRIFEKSRAIFSPPLLLKKKKKKKNFKNFQKIFLDPLHPMPKSIS